MSEISPPISVVSPTDHGALILITNGFGLCLILIFTIIRVFARLFINPPFDKDDLLMGVATVSIHSRFLVINLIQSTALGYNLLGTLVLPCLEGIW